MWNGQRDFMDEIMNNHIQAEDGQTRWNGKNNFKDESKTTTYMLRMGRQCGMVRATPQMDQEQPHTSWGWANKMKWSEQLQRWIKNNHIHAEDEQTIWIGQSNSTDGSRTTTYKLKMSRKCGMIRGTSHMDQEQSHTTWGWADNVKWSEQLHRWIKKNHIQAEDGQTMWNDQRDFTYGSRTTTYSLRMGRQCEMVRATLQMNQEQQHTNWGWAENVESSEGLHRWIKNNHIPPEDGQTMWNGQSNSTDGSGTTTYILRMDRQCKTVRGTSQMDQEQPQTSWEWADNVKWSEGLHRWIKNNHILSENWQTM